MHSFNFIEHTQRWTNSKDTLDPSLLYHDKLHQLQKGNIKLSESIITATEDKHWSKHSFQQDVKQET